MVVSSAAAKSPSVAQREFPPASTVPNPGIYTNVPFDVYTSWDALNHSRLKRMGLSPMHFNEPDEDKETDSKTFGVAFHEIMLEPAKFAARVVGAPINEKTGKPYGRDTQAWAKYAADRPGKLILTDDELTRIKAMRAKLVGCPDVTAFFEPGGGAMYEVCIVWDCPVTGMRCKGRVDVWMQRPNKMVARLDLKTTRCAAYPAFCASVAKFGYHTQDAFYEMGCRALGFDSYGLLLPIESNRPHGFLLAPIGDVTLQAARAEVGDWQAKVKRCRETGEWPGYEVNTSVAFEAPSWYLRAFIDDDVPVSMSA